MKPDEIQLILNMAADAPQKNLHTARATEALLRKFMKWYLEVSTKKDEPKNDAAGTDKPSPPTAA